MSRNATRLRLFWIVFVCLPGQAFSQPTRELCTDALMDRVSSDTGRAVAIALDDARTYYISGSEEGFRGTVSIRVKGQSTTRSDFDCRVNTRSRYVTALDLGGQTGPALLPPTPASGTFSGGTLGNSPCSVPTLYADDDLRGKSLAVDRSMRDLHDQNFGDEASSLCVPYGWQVVLHADTGYRGDRLQISGPREIDDLKRDRPEGQDWGDRISSIEVLRVQPDASLPEACGSVPMLYSESGFKGASLKLDQSRPDLHRQGFGDKASSICVGAGWVVEVFADTGYRGDRLRLNGQIVVSDLKRDRPEGQDWGDRISSVRVSRAALR